MLGGHSIDASYELFTQKGRPRVRKLVLWAPGIDKPAVGYRDTLSFIEICYR